MFIVGIVCGIILLIDVISLFAQISECGGIAPGLAYAICRPIWFPLNMFTGLIVHLVILIGGTFMLTKFVF